MSVNDTSNDTAIANDDPERAIDQAARAQNLMPWSADPWLVRGEAELLAGDRQTAEASFRKALEIDAGDWRGWHDLAVATSGAERRRAFRQALSLYPRSSEIARTMSALRAEDR